MNPFLTFRYYFNPYPGSNFEYNEIILFIALFILALGIPLFLYPKKGRGSIHKKWLKNYGKRLINMGIFALALLFFREVGLPYLSMRLWWVLWLALFIALNFFAVKQCKKAKERIVVKTSAKSLDSRVKYLPKKKKRK